MKLSSNPVLTRSESWRFLQLLFDFKFPSINPERAEGRHPHTYPTSGISASRGSNRHLYEGGGVAAQSSDCKSIPHVTRLKEVSGLKTPLVSSSRWGRICCGGGSRKVAECSFVCRPTFRIARNETRLVPFGKQSCECHC